MPEFNDDLDANLPEDEDSVFEPDPARIAFLDQEEARFADIADEFEQYYGFTHECQCGADYAAGRVVEIPLCYANLLGEAMEACRRLVQERNLYLELAQALGNRLEELTPDAPSNEDIAPTEHEVAAGTDDGVQSDSVDNDA